MKCRPPSNRDPEPAEVKACSGYLDGQVKLKIPNETQSGRLFRLKGKGVRSVRSNRQGDLMCRVQVETPVKLSGQQKDLLKDFEQSMGSNTGKHNPRAKRWLDSVRQFFSRATS